MRFLGLAAFSLLSAVAAPAFAQPVISRGEQYMAIGFPECMSRARTAFERLGWVNIGAQANLTSAFKGTESAYIVCNETTGGRYVINIFVASSSGDGGVAGYQRQQLQGGMDGQFPVAGLPAPPPPPANNAGWTLGCCSGQYKGDVTLNFGPARGSVVPFTGEFSAALNGGRIIGGTWDQATGAVNFRRDLGSGMFQDYAGQMVNQNGKLRVINGRWSGAYSDRGTPDWFMEQK